MDHFQWDSGITTFLITWLVTAIFIHFAAKIVLDKSSFVAALLTALVGTFLAILVGALVGGTLGIILAIATWALVCALFYRTGWIKAAVVGLVAWVLYFIVVWIVARLFD